MPTTEHLRALGHEIDRLRKLHKKSVKDLAEAISLSPQRLSEIINAYQKPKRPGLVLPSDDVLDGLAQVFDLPVSHFHALLGRIPEYPPPLFEHAETMNLALGYDRLPDYARRTMQDVLRRMQELVTVVEPKK